MVKEEGDQDKGYFCFEKIGWFKKKIKGNVQKFR